MTTRRKCTLTLLCATATIAIAGAPYRLTWSGLVEHGAFADDDGKGSGGDDSGGNSGRGGDDGDGSDGGDDDDGDDNSGPGGDDDDDDGEDDDDDDDNSGPGGHDDNDDDDEDDDDDFGRRSNEHVNPATGDKVEINGSNIEVLHPDGSKEEIEDGRYEKKDPSGRTVIERRATESDRARLRAMIG